MRIGFVFASLVLVACGPGGDDTPGACTDTALIAGDLVISEVFADADAPTGASGADEGKEWFEVYNNSDRAVDLEGMTITHARPDGSMAKNHVMRTVTVPPNGYVVLGNTLPDLVPAWVDYGYADELGDMFNTGGGRITLSCGDAEIDTATYDMVDAGVSRQFDGGGLPDYTANDDLANWCAATPEGASEFSPENFGTPRSPNEDCAVVIAGQCNDGGNLRDTVPPEPGDLVITEIMPSPDAVEDAVGEWFEVLVTRDVDLNDLVLQRAGGPGGADPVLSEDCLRVTAGEYVVFARSDDATVNGGLAAVRAEFGFTMVGGSASSPGDVQLVYGTTVIDAFTWTNTSNGAALQVDPDFANAADNDFEANWCDATAVYGAGDLGTPGAPNEDCPVVIQPGECLDETTGTPRAIVKPVAGDLAITEWMVDPTLVGDPAGEWLELRAATAFDLNGLQLGDEGTPLRAAVTVVACVPVAAGDYILFAQSTDPVANGGVMGAVAAFPTGVDLGNSLTRSIIVGIDDVALDTRTWAYEAGNPNGTNPVAGVSIQIDGDGSQCNAPAETPAYNGTDLGTPGAAHAVECP